MPRWTVPGPLDHSGQTHTRIRPVVSLFPRDGATRGKKVALHAEALGQSRDSSLTFQWTMAVSDDKENAGISPDVREKVAAWRGPQRQTLTFVPLCSVNVTLTVSDGGLKASTRVRVTVRPRVDPQLFKTTVKLPPPFTPAVGTAFRLVAPRERWWSARLTEGSIRVDPDLNLPLGKNVCTLCTPPQGDPPENDHFIHAAAKGGPPWDWMDEQQGFTLAQLDDPGGPFHQFYYVCQCYLFLDRTVLINSELIDVGKIHHENQATGHAKDFEALVESVRAHEHLHGALMEEKWKQLTDPLAKVEALIYPGDPEVLKNLANFEISEIETKLKEAAGAGGHPRIGERLRSMGFAKPRTVRLPRVMSEGPAFRDFTASFAGLAIED